NTMPARALAAFPTRGSSDLGEIVATPERGTFMGNRGVLHDGEGRILRAWQLKRWIVCVLEFRGRKRQVMTPGRYTELFFVDEARSEERRVGKEGGGGGGGGG